MSNLLKAMPFFVAKEQPGPMVRPTVFFDTTITVARTNPSGGTGGGGSGAGAVGFWGASGNRPNKAAAGAGGSITNNTFTLGATTYTINALWWPAGASRFGSIHLSPGPNLFPPVYGNTYGFQFGNDTPVELVYEPRGLNNYSLNLPTNVGDTIRIRLIKNQFTQIPYAATNLFTNQVIGINRRAGYTVGKNNIYRADSGSLFSISTTTGMQSAATIPLTFSQRSNPRGIDQHADGSLYMIAEDSPFGGTFRLLRASSIVTSGTTFQNVATLAMSIPNNTLTSNKSSATSPLYTIINRRLYSINKATGALTAIGAANSLPDGTVRGLEYHKNVLYCIIDSKLYSINVTTGVPSELNSFDHTVLLIGSNGNALYANVYDAVGIIITEIGQTIPPAPVT